MFVNNKGQWKNQLELLGEKVFSCCVGKIRQLVSLKQVLTKLCATYQMVTKVDNQSDKFLRS
jgi:hypothetical protein